jgi:hypothetical protein
MKPTSSLPTLTSESTDAVNCLGEIHSYHELQQRIHDDLRVQHPEWIQPNGDCPTCETYERRLAESIAIFQSSERQSVTA